jgi:allophanate hydrolase
LDIGSLRRAYREGTATPSAVAEAVADKIAANRTEGIWTHLRDGDDLVAEARALEQAWASKVPPPLYGIPFAVKDSIDVEGLPTTVGCPALRYVATESATVVARIVRSGGICVGKTNLDQFATGLVGVRSPYGIPPNAFDPRYVTGGSSSGSAAAVARGLVSWALATDTAGSGRVPAAFNRLVGLKPSRGLLSTRGLVPACRSIDCVTVMSLTCEDARIVAQVAAAFDPRDPYSKVEASAFEWRARPLGGRFRAAVPRDEDLAACDAPTRQSFARARAEIEAMDAVVETVDMSVFFEAGRLLYDGPWVAERLAEFESLAKDRPDAILPVIRTILAQGERYAATDAFRALQRLTELKRAAEPVWKAYDVLVVPTAPTLPTMAEIEADPIGGNARLGLFTTFGNLLDLSGVAVPGPLRSDGLPFGVTFLGPWGRDATLLAIASAFHARIGGPLGATDWPWPRRGDAPESPPPDDALPLAVVGAHLSGMPLNHQLTDRGAKFLRVARTAPLYRLYALPDATPPKPGLVRVQDGEGVPVEVEVWAVPMAGVGSFVAGVASPLAIGTVELEGGDRVHGFVCEGHVVARARDISGYGGWRAYLNRPTP